MNCANHPQSQAAAYCRTCGKPLCASCTRPVNGVIYCETCLGERVAGTVPPQQPYQPVTNVGTRVPPQGSSSGPNPALAGLLGAIPFGVGAIYNGQYTKGLVHLGIFVFLVVSLSSDLPGYLYPILGIAMAFFIAYQIMDAVRTAKALQANQPAPDPFGFTTMFSPGPATSATSPSVSTSRNAPFGAIVLIVLGILFLLHNLDIWFLRTGVLWPLVLIGIGVWILAKRFSSAGGPAGCGARRLMGPAVLITLGTQFLLSNLGIVSFGRTLPVLLIVIGVILAVERSSPRLSSAGNTTPITPESPQEPTVNVAPPEVKNG